MRRSKSSPGQQAAEQGMQAAADGKESSCNPYDARSQNDLWSAWRRAFDAKLLADKLCQ